MSEEGTPKDIKFFAQSTEAGDSDNTTNIIKPLKLYRQMTNLYCDYCNTSRQFGCQVICHECDKPYNDFPISFSMYDFGTKKLDPKLFKCKLGAMLEIQKSYYCNDCMNYPNFIPPFPPKLKRKNAISHSEEVKFFCLLCKKIERMRIHF